jgi:hypothetical protein
MMVRKNRNMRIAGDPLAGLSAARRKRFKALIETGEAFKDVPPEEIEREIARLIEEDRLEQRAQRRVPAERP